MKKILYDIKNLSHSYEGGPVVLNIDTLQIEEGSVTGLIGPNGSGKSTLLKVLAFLEAHSGSVTFDGQESHGHENEIRQNVTYLLQDSYLLKRTVYENIAYGLKLRGENVNIKARCFDAMLRVGLLPEKFADRLWYRLSGGEVQRAALAARLALHPKALLLDEPTANVDEASAQLVKEAAISAWKEWGTTVIVATHDLPWLYEVSTEIVSLYKGRIVGHGAENIIQAQWRTSDGKAVLTFADGQQLFGLYNGHKEIEAAFISPSDVTVTALPTESEPNILHGTVTQMVLERGRSSVLVSADISGTIIKSRISLAETEALAICPSKNVGIRIKPQDIRWME